MAEFAYLPIPRPESGKRPPGGGGRDNVRRPTRARQVRQFGPVFRRLRDALKEDHDPLTLRDDPAAFAPERALVLEVAGRGEDFYQAVRRIAGLEYLGEEEVEFEPDADFAELDTRKGLEDQVRVDRPLAGRLYLAMPDTEALRQLLSLWERYSAGEQAPRGFGDWFNLFRSLRELRSWGPLDRVPESTIRWLTDQTEGQTDPVRAEFELWSYASNLQRRRSAARFEQAVHSARGEILCRASVPEIAYEAALVALPPAEILRLQQRESSPLANCDEVMFIRPQTTAESPASVELLSSGPLEEPAPPADQPPIAALLDAVPVVGHRLLDGRVQLDDPDDLGALSVVSERRHGTEMASLILYGDRNRAESALARPIYVRPVLYAPGEGAPERSQPDRLFIDTIYRAVLRLKVGDQDGGAPAPTVFLVNLSLGDPGRPFTGSISPWARLLDYLADRFGILFLVSAGNIREPLSLPDSNDVGDLHHVTPDVRARVVLEALGSQRSQRTLLSPAEALNVVTVGGWSEDDVDTVSPSALVFPPYDGEPGPNITSAMGLGHRKVIKPDIFMPAGREHVHVMRRGTEYAIRHLDPGRLYGLRAAAPDPGGRLDGEGLTAGTSAATALATRAAHRLYDALMDEENGAILDGVDPRYYGVVVKALLVHRSRWGDKGALLDDLYGPRGQGKHVARKDNIARVLGYGRPCVEEAMTCAANRATMVGHGLVASDGRAKVYRVPLPASLERVTEPRCITLTLAWFSPVNVRHLGYRRAKLEIRTVDLRKAAGASRAPHQPADPSVGRGSLFHVRYEGDEAVQFIGDGHIMFKVFCREQAGAMDQGIRYGLAVTIEAGDGVPVYQEIRQRLGIQPRVTGNTP